MLKRYIFYRPETNTLELWWRIEYDPTIQTWFVEDQYSYIFLACAPYTNDCLVFICEL